MMRICSKEGFISSLHHFNFEDAFYKGSDMEEMKNYDMARIHKLLSFLFHRNLELVEGEEKIEEFVSRKEEEKESNQNFNFKN